jgi:hypothetical protein
MSDEGAPGLRRLSGGCLCGQVRYTVNAAPYGSALCHCRTCQKAHAAPVVGFFSVRKADLQLTGGLSEYRSSDHAVRRFCPNCGTQLLFDDARYPDELDVAIATLDDPAAAPPAFHIWTRSQVPWLQLADSLPRYPERRGG